MFENISLDKIKTAVAVYHVRPTVSKKEYTYFLEELNLLAKTLGIRVLNTFLQRKESIEPDYYIGRGKLSEIKEYINNNEVDCILFDNDLSGVQERNLEKYLNKTILGRTEIILYIFYKRAKTNESRLQVQLAFLEYMMPRVHHRWSHFSRVEGGIGLRGGEGEKQVELDKRMIKEQIQVLKKKLKKVDTQMKTRRKNRLNENIVSLVGYTNAGKSTLFNRLAKVNQFTEDMLFATLETTVRKVFINENLTILINDTIGFINKLPHYLVISFKSTLEEIVNSRLILHVIDASSEMVSDNIRTVNDTLDEIGANQIHKIRVFNKIDLVEHKHMDSSIRQEEEDVFISALNGEGIDLLKDKIIEFFDA